MKVNTLIKFIPGFCLKGLNYRICLCSDDRLFHDIRHVLGRGLIFLHQLVHQDADVGLLMANAEGEYQVLIHGLIDNLKFMHFSEQEGEW